MYGLKQNAVLSYNNQLNNIAPHGYVPCKYSTDPLWHATKKTEFCFYVYDFGFKYFSDATNDHILKFKKNIIKYSLS